MSYSKFDEWYYFAWEEGDMNIAFWFQFNNLHKCGPRTHVSGFSVLTSTMKVGAHKRITDKSAMLKLVKKIFVEFLISLVLIITMGT